MWLEFRQSVPCLLAPEAKIELSAGKSVYNKEFEGNMYICFDQEFTAKERDEKNQPKTLNSYINFTGNEWEKFVGVLWEIDKVIPCFLTEKCAICNDAKHEWEMFDGRMYVTRLSSKKLREAIAANAVDMTALPVVCDYCGGEPRNNSNCHCHKYDCRQCSRENFCRGCGKNRYRPRQLV